VQLPYYKEQFKDSGLAFGIQPLTSAGVPTGSPTIGEWAIKDTVMTGFRTSPKSEHYIEVPDITADPYAYFLEYVSKSRYEENLRQRGYTFTNPLPDRGHTLDLATFSPFGQRVSGKLSYKAGTTWVYFGLTNLVPSLPASFATNGPFQGGVVGPATNPASNLSAFAQKAYARSAPTFEQFNLTRFLGELHELPRVRLDFLSKSIGEWRFQGDKWIQKGANRLGDDSLNVMFGWAPLVTDWISLCRALVSVTTGMMGGPEAARPIHRTYGIPDETSTYTVAGSTTSVDFTNNSILTDADLRRPTLSGSNVGPSISYNATKRYTRSLWFEGSFSKFLPLGFDPSSYLDRASVLLNTKIDVETIWKLTPWTWLSDWVVDISSTIAANQAASDKSLISHYAYAMEHTDCSVYLDWSIDANTATRVWEPSGPTRGSFVNQTVFKKRIRANPFGFVPGGPSGLNPFRTAVLAALGLSKA
jgi:hypothetical protein